MAPRNSEVDVLIVGAGPAGLMAATWMARCGINARIIDKRGTKVFRGQADGLNCRTMEIFDSFGFADRVWKESNHLQECCFWNPDSDGKIYRSERMPDTVPDASRFQSVMVLHQGRIESFLLDFIKENSDIRVERGVLPESLSFDESKSEDLDAYPIEVTLRHLSEEDANPDPGMAQNDADEDTDRLLNGSQMNGKAGTTETVRAKYMIGCDGAHSWTRGQLGYQMEGEQTDYIWGVLDIIPITDFPDIRSRCAIHSAESGSIMIIPRENKLVRLYIQMTTTEKGGDKLDRSSITPESILKAAQKTLAPYKLTYNYCHWWTAYQIGQRIGSNYSRSNRIFLAGDAVHTHSPKAGQGMNVSMQDTYNLGWKLASVLKGTATRDILDTYESERRKIAQELIAFDHKLSRLFSGRPAKDVTDEAGISMQEFKEYLEKGSLFAVGVTVDYGASFLIAKEGNAEDQGHVRGSKVVGKQNLARNVKIGMRIPDYKVLNQSDGRPWGFQQLLESDGRWRIAVFAGNVSVASQMERIRKLGHELAAENGFIKRLTPKGKGFDEVIEVLTIHAAPRVEVDLSDFPEVFHPYSESEGWDYWKIYVDDVSYHEGHGKAYENYGIDPNRGCLVVLRPDQHVGWIGEIKDVEKMDQYFSVFMASRA